jgi:O-antigen/teichoic acid export membrane protein
MAPRPVVTASPVDALPPMSRSPTINRHDPQQPPPFSVRKVVPASSSSASGPGPRTAPGASRAGAAVDTDSHAVDQNASGDQPPPTVNSGLRWTMMRTAVVEVVNLLGVVVLARLVAPADFGRYAIALIVLLLATVPTWGVQYTIVQREHIDRDHLRTGQTLTIVVGLAMCALCFAASFTIVPILFGARTAVLVRLMVPACFLNSVNTVQCAIIARRLEFRRSSLVDMTTSVVGALVAIPLAVMGLNGAAIVLGVDAGSLAGFILICFWVRPPLPHFRLHSARDFARSGIPAASNAASLVCFQNCDYVIVGARVSALSAGYYFRAYSLGVVYQTKISQVLTTVGIPVLSRVRDEEEIHRLRQRMIQTITIILFPLLTALAIVAPKFVTWLYGPAWHASIVPVQILTIGGAAMLVAQAVTVAMLAAGRPRAVSRWGWSHFFVYAAAVFAVARLGLPAVAIAAVTVHTTFLIISYLQLYHFGVGRAFKAFAKDLLPATVSSACLAAVALPASMLASSLGIPILPYLLLITLAGSLGYFVSMRLWFPAQLRDLAGFVGRLLPARAHRLFGGRIMRPQAQSAA